MTRFKAVFFVGIFIFFASVGLARFGASHLRVVDAMGIWASGMGCGAAGFGFVVAVASKTKNAS